MKFNFNDIWEENDKYFYEYHTKTGNIFNKKAVHFQFISKYPHYNIQDIIWMIDQKNKRDSFYELIVKANNDWSKTIDIGIGTLRTKKASKSNMSQNAIDIACEKQFDLREEWSEKTGIDYPDLEMPKRKAL